MWSFPPWGTSSGSEKQNQEGSPSPQSRTKDCDFRGPSCKSELQSVIYSLGTSLSVPLRLPSTTPSRCSAGKAAAH